MARSIRHAAAHGNWTAAAGCPYPARPAKGEHRMLRIWGRNTSSNVMKVLWLCEELGIPYERIDAGGTFGRTRDPDYLAMNPNALVPTIQEPDGYTLWESNSILRYLARSRAAGHPVHPAAPREAGLCERWMDWQLASLNRPMTTVFFTYVRTPPEKRDWPATHKARDEAEKLWRMVDAQLQGRDFLCGPQLTLADIALGPYLHRWFAMPIERAEMPALRGWYDRLCTRPGYAKHVAVELS
jgi:glutathione S-transferase